MRRKPKPVGLANDPEAGKAWERPQCREPVRTTEQRGTVLTCTIRAGKVVFHTMKRLAVSILLTRDLDSTEIFLVQRNPAPRFFGGFLAFPGGTVDAEDANLPVRNLPGRESGLDREFHAFVVTAARELFEETGIWAGHGKTRPPREQLDDYRRKLLDEQIQFSEILTRAEQILDASDFVPICRITTPPFRSVRYDTWFLRYQVPPDARPEVWPGELESGEFLAADEALARWRRNEVLIVPPVIILLRELMGRNCRSFLTEVRTLTESYARGKLHQVHFTPGVLLAPLKTRPLPPATHTNACVVGEERVYLVDPGPEDRDEQRKLWELLDELLDEGREFLGLLLTHHHPDHIGAVSECQRRYGLPVYAHRLTAEHLPKIEFSGFLEHGQSLDLGLAPDGKPGWKLDVYHLPGHASGHLAFKETRYRSVLAGDLISTLSPILIDPSDGDLAAYMNSLEFLHSITEAFVYPAHGAPALEGRQAIRKTIRHRQEREARLLEILRKGAQTSAALLRQIYQDVPKELHPLAMRSLLSGLIKLEREGKAREVDGRYGLVERRPTRGQTRRNDSASDRKYGHTGGSEGGGRQPEDGRPGGRSRS